MAETSYHFIPYVRRGYAPANEFEASSDIKKPRLNVKFKVTGEDDTGKETPPEEGSVTINMIHPGYITGIDTGEIIRMNPEPGTHDFKPNDVAFIEFNAPDLPWAFSPVRAAADGKALPWLMLIVVERTEGTRLIPSGSRPLPSLKVPVSELPPAHEAWAWAHVQVTGSEPSLSDFETTSLQTRSRLVASRNLQQNKSYIAALVPIFEAGRLAGLGQAVPPGTDNDTLAYAWETTGESTGGDTVELPVYTSWEFSTGARGDFEYFVRQLEPRNLNQPQFDIGSVPVDVMNPGPPDLYITDETQSRTVQMEGALRKIDGDTASESDYTKADALRDLLQLRQTEDGKRVIGPPVYGSWHALQWVLEETPATGKEWLYTLNLHPGFRLAAALGAQIVRESQESLMISAWRQVGQIKDVNRLLGLAQLSQQVLRRKQEQLDNALDENSDADNAWKLLFTAPMHRRVNAGTQTVFSTLEPSRLPHAMVSAAFRRLLRPEGPARTITSTSTNALVEGVASGTLDPAPVRETDVPHPGQSIDGLCRQITRAREAADAQIERNEHVEQVLMILNDLVERVMNLIQALYHDDKQAYGENHEIAVSQSEELRHPLMEIADSSAELASVADALTADVANNRLNSFDELLMGVNLNNIGDEGVNLELWIQRLQSALAILQELIGYIQLPGTVEQYLEQLICSSVPGKKPARPRPDLKGLASAFDFEGALIQRIDKRLGGVNLDAREAPFDQIMVYPTFPQPMYQDLKELSEAYLLPGVEEIAPNTVGVLQTNPAFIEAFMTGLNHEMASELQWRRYPTDRRGSYFRQFWDPATRVPPPATKEEAYDISKIHTWDDKVDEDNNNQPLPSHLGDNNINGADEAEVVLIIRGKLLQRYPNTTIYMAKAYRDQSDEESSFRQPRWLAKDTDPGKVDEAEQRFPLFQARIEPDITCLGFNLTPRQATGEDATPLSDNTETDKEGWFIVLEEAPGDLRFGLDVADKPTAETACIPLKDLQIEDDQASSNLKPAETGADVALALWQTSVRVAIHADDLIPIDRPDQDGDVS